MYGTEFENTNSEIYDELSLESILAEYSDFDAEKAAGHDTAERSRQIVYEALGETQFSGGVERDDADGEEIYSAGPYDSAGPYAYTYAPEFGAPAGPDYAPEPEYEPPEYEPEPGYAPARDYYRSAGQYTHRLRRGFERFGRHVNPPAEDEYTPEPAGEPDFAGDDDVKVYQPAAQFTPPEGDEDVKVYGASGYIAEAERRSAKWRRDEPAGDDFADYGAAPEDYAPEDYGAGDFAPYEDEVREYGYDSGDEAGFESYAAPGSENGPRDYGRAPKAGPVLGFLAKLGVRLGNARTAGSAVAPEDAEDLGEEMPAKKAAKYYAGSVNSLRVRFRLALLPTAALLWISLGLPAFGALGSDLKVTSLVCLILQLAVVMLGLDIFTSGIMSLARGRAGILSLLAAANVAAALDAAVAYAVGTAGWGYPMCAAAALGMLFALWGALLEARALRFSVKARELAEEPMSVTAESGIDGREGAVLLKSRRAPDGWLHRCEEPDAAESLFSVAAPWLLAAAFILSLIATVITRQWTYFFRVLAALTCAAAPAAAFVACPLPYFLLALRAYRMGAAVAGWPGMQDIGRSLGMVITDSDLFPGDSVKISSIRILAAARPEDVISAAGSVIIASGSGLAPVFAELMRRNGCAMRRVEDFCCHEGGGLTALIAGEEVLCGSAGFMRLMGVLVPQKLADKSAVFISVNGVLCGIFNIEYSPVKSVGRALNGCLKSRRAPIFAVRDFLVTPLLLHRRYGVPAEGFDFPPFATRYAVSSAEPAEGSSVCALLGREGLGGFMEVSGCGRRCYLSARLGTALSGAASAACLLAAFALYAFGGGLSAAWLLALYALFALPGIIASLAGTASR